MYRNILAQRLSRLQALSINHLLHKRKFSTCKVTDFLLQFTLRSMLHGKSDQLFQSSNVGAVFRHSMWPYPWAPFLILYADTTFSHNIKTSEVINIDYLVKWHLGWEILVGRGKVSFWKQEKWASVRICATFTRAKLWWLDDWIRAASLVGCSQYAAVSTYQKGVQERTPGELATGWWAHKAHWCTWGM